MADEQVALKQTLRDKRSLLVSQYLFNYEFLILLNASCSSLVAFSGIIGN